MLLICVGLACAGGLGGCYERTVRAKGIGAMNRNVQKPYRSETILDKAVDTTFGQPKPTPARSR